MVTLVAILVAAFLVHAWNRWHRWSTVESDSVRRTTTMIPAGEIPELEIVQYEYAYGQKPANAPPIVLLVPEDRYLRIIDQYATGLCLAEFPVAILKWKTGQGEDRVSFANIAAKVESLLNPAASGITYFVYRKVAQEVVQGVACAAKNPNNRWILISPQIRDARRWEIFSGSGEKIHIIFSLNSPKKIRTSIEDLTIKLKIPAQNLASFPIGGMDLMGQETVALGKMISWNSKQK